MGTVENLFQRRAEFSDLLRDTEPDYDVDRVIAEAFDAHRPDSRLVLHEEFDRLIEIERTNPLEANEFADLDEVERALVNAAEFMAIDPYDLEQNLSDLTVVLDRLLSFRREINAIEAERIKAGLGYIAALDAADAELDLELARANPVTPAVRSAAEKRAEVTKSAVAALKEQHAKPGGPLNFTERRNKLEAQMRLDVGSFYHRSRAVLIGRRKAGMDRYRVPGAGFGGYAKFSGARLLDDWCMWHRLILRDVESVRSAESVYELSLSLGMPTQAGGEGNLVLVPDLMDQLRASREVSFSLNAFPRMFLPHKWNERRARLLAIALSTNLTREQQPHWRYQATIEVPEEADTADPAVPRQEERDAISITHITHVTEDLRWHDRGKIRNRPVFGNWRIAFDADPVHNSTIADVARTDPAQWPLLDLVLHLRVAS
ncbi:MAG: hypothetical protein M3Q08_00300 [Pseudomonadota bacterium]|nr:hypothetical protein [Pseudomonadota bacterium]